MPRRTTGGMPLGRPAAWLRAVVLLLLVAACAGGEPVAPQVRLVDLRLLESGLFEQRFEIDLRIGNPNDFALPLDGLTFDLEINGADFAQGFSDQRVTVPRLGEGIITVTATTTLIDLVQQMKLLAERGDLAYRLGGVAYLTGLARRSVPYESEGTFRLLDRQGTPGRTTSGQTT